MESKRRHELDKNSAEEILKRIQGFLTKYRLRIVLTILAVALVYFGLTIHNRNKRNEAIRILNTFEECNSLVMSGKYDAEKLISQYRTLIDQDSNPRIALMSMVELGGLYVTQAGDAETPERMKTVLDRAVDYYNQAVKTAGNLDEYRFLRAKSHLGLATVAEDRGKFDDAVKECDTILAIKGIEGSFVYRQAEVTKKRLKDAKKVIKFPTTQPAWIAERIRKAEEEARKAAEAAESQPASAPASQPASAPASGPASAPAK